MIFARQFRRFASSNPVLAVLAQPVNPKPKHHPDHPESQRLADAVGDYIKPEPELKGNDLRLQAGKAQAIRVNDPNRYIKHDERDFSTYDASKDKATSFRGAVVGGSDIKDAGIELSNSYALNLGSSQGNMRKTAWIFYRQGSHMHNVSTSDHFAKGPWAIQFEGWGGTKDPLDGSHYGGDPRAMRHIFGFSSVEDAVKYCNDLGFAYYVTKPHFRNHTRKSYADNFKYKPPK
eukprot:CAMPEP_0204918322 /NCGR_PEP_ID=MMETSP1397-20131031/16078_1 /ASSEMBLY_ACC=CAM_ASM_000891 /TAXON_ID=49980 /ORGANISM="Climacostomum Climacostomum virens, Strain Stock W-24" /LENGTH=232 /DNA_ID=CAMNT_0052091575 /DNA_START=1 /DNA_END=702 /DNA_ORIENTATION=+